MHNTFTTTAALPVQQSSQDIHIMMMHLFDEAKATLLHVKASSDLPTSPNQVIANCNKERKRHQLELHTLKYQIQHHQDPRVKIK